MSRAFAGELTLGKAANIVNFIPDALFAAPQTMTMCQNGSDWLAPALLCISASVVRVPRP